MYNQQQGFANNFDQFQTQQMPQQGYQNNSYNGSNPFAPPPGYQQNQYNGGGMMMQQNVPHQQPQNQFYNNSYQQPLNQQGNNGYYDNNYGNNTYNQGPMFQPSHNDDDYPQKGRETVEPNNIVFGLDHQQQNNGVRKTSDDNLKENGQSNWDQGQPNQESAPSKPQAKPIKKRRTFREMKRSMSSYSAGGKSGVLISVLGLCGTFVLLILIITLMIYHFAKKDVELTSISGGLEYMAFNLNSDPILELTWSTAGCPAGTEGISLGNWPGTVYGCDCPITGVSQGACTRKEDYLCTDVSDIDPIYINSWENSVGFCAKRAKLGTDYIKATSCPSGYTECFTSMCFLNSVNCPLTSITFETTSSGSNTLFANGKYASLSYTTGAAPVIDLDASLNDVPCFSNTEIPDGGGDYTLLKKRPDGCKAYGADSTFSFKIDSLSENALLGNNHFPSDVFQLPHYQTILNNAVTYLAGRKRITVANKEECLSIDTAILSGAGDAAGDMNRYISGTAITVMILHGILFMFVCAALCEAKKSNSWKAIFRGADSGVWLVPYIGLGFCELITLIVMVALERSARARLINAKTYLVGLDELDCFPVGPPQMVIDDYDNAVDQVASTLNNLATCLLAITIITYVPVFVTFVYRNCKK